MSELPVYELTRIFDAPRDLVWKAWTDPALLARWYGPNVETIVHELDVRPGGRWLTEMRMAHGSGFQRADFTDVNAPESFTCLMSTTDETWQPAANPMMPDWPRTLLTKVNLTETGDITHLQLIWQPHEATEAEIACFAAAIEGAGKGWSAGMDLLEKLLAELAG